MRQVILKWVCVSKEKDAAGGSESGVRVLPVKAGVSSDESTWRRRNEKVVKKKKG